MDSASEDLYFQKLQELIQDEDKIITVSLFASDLGISIQNSQKLIRKYVNDQRKLKPEELAVTYVLTGTLKNDKGKGVLMVKENDLKEKRELFEDDPYNLIYSIQKSKHVDFNIIALVDMFDSTKIRDQALKGSIVSKNCVKRALQFKKLPSPRPSTLKGKSSFFAPKPGNSAEGKKQQPESSKNNQKTNPSSGIADLFKTAATKSNQQTSEKGSVSNSTKSNKQFGKRNGGLAGFLTNGPLKPKTLSNCEAKKEDTVTNKENSCNKTESQDNIKEDDIVELLDTDFEEATKDANEDNISKKDTKKKNKPAKKKQNKRQRDTSEEMPSKKRKRIIERNDSDSDDMFERERRNEDIEDFIEKSDEEAERVPSPIREKPLPPKNKRRKAVTRNYEDEEGFIVTKTEYIYETASEDENEEQKPPKQEKLEKPEKQEKPKPKANEKKKIAKNQSTLMQFFKKA